jgi:predicted methyltransferase
MLQHLGAPLFTPESARRILEGERRISLDLGLSTKSILVERNMLTLPNGEFFSLIDLEKIASKSDSVFTFLEGKFLQVAISNGRYYKLVPTDGAPTLEIDGIRMHKTKDIKPEEDAQAKITALELTKGKVLDTCTGLGYTAIASLRKGAELVISVERYWETLQIAVINPWSQTLFTSSRIHLLLGDSYSMVDAFPNRIFDYVVHDPPRLSHAGHLYSKDFYSKLYRVLRERGKIIHYVGAPGSKYRRVDLRKGVIQRLRQVGFQNIRHIPEILSIIGYRGK